MSGKGGDLQTLFQSLNNTIIVAAIMILIGDDIRMVMINMKTMIIRIIIFINIRGIMLIFDICIFILRRWKKSKKHFCLLLFNIFRICCPGK